MTPLHLAARDGQYNICKLILSKITDKNPADNNGITPFHLAARKCLEYKKLCQLFIENIEEKYPKDDKGKPPLTESALCSLMDTF